MNKLNIDIINNTYDNNINLINNIINYNKIEEYGRSPFVFFKIL